MPRTKAPKLRAWGKPARKVMSMTIHSEKEKQRERHRQKELLKKELSEENLG